jgi:hypothetical protein
MTAILFFTILGFFCGLGAVMIKRKIRPGSALAATLVGLSSMAIWKIFKELNSRGNRRRRY